MRQELTEKEKKKINVFARKLSRKPYAQKRCAEILKINQSPKEQWAEIAQDICEPAVRKKRWIKKELQKRSEEYLSDYGVECTWQFIKFIYSEKDTEVTA